MACGGSEEHKTPPDTQIDSGPAELTNVARATIGFSALGNANTFLCSLDSAAPTQCVPPFVADVTDGPHMFTVAAALNDAVDDSPATTKWTVDTVAPDTTITLPPPVLDNTLTPTITFAGSDNLGVKDFECKIDDGAFAACVSPLTVQGVAEGTHTFTVRAHDTAGNVDATPAIATWTIDLSAPDTAINAGPLADSTSGPTGSFTFTATDAAATFECSFDGGAFAACTSPAAFNLADGAHTFAVRAKDNGGNVDPSPANRAWTVDAIAPAITLDTTPTDPTNLAAPTFAFSSPETGATFTCRIDNGAAAACTSPFTGGTLADGQHTFEVRALDAVGNASPAAFTWTIDTAAPTVTIVSAPPAFVASADVSVTFTTAGDPVTVECALDAGAFAACTSPFAAAGLADGPHTIQIRATDAATNTGLASTSFTVDTAPPTVAITSAPTLTNDNTPTFEFTVAGAAIVACSLDGGAFVACTSPTTTARLADGAHTFTVRATDQAGNSATASADFTVDTVPPSVAITAQPPAATNDNTATISFTAGNGATVTDCRVDTGAFLPCTSPFTTPPLLDGAHSITVRATDGAGNTASASASFTVDTQAPTVTITDQPPPLSNDNTPAIAFTTAGSPSTTECKVDNGPFAACGSPFAPGTLADGGHTITVQVIDTAGNSSSAAATFTIDATPPTITFISQPPTLTNDNTPTVTFNVGGSPTTVECRVDGGAFAACTSPFTTATLADGDHTITVRATDAASNVATRSAAFTIDATPPTVTITVPPAPVSSDATPTISFTVAGATTIACAVDNSAFAACTSPFTTPALGDGSHVVTVRATDPAGNIASAATSPFVVDTVPPTVAITSQPPAITNNNTPATAFTTTGATTIECRVDAGTFAACTSPFTPAAALPDGPHTVTVRVSDDANNTASATTASFDVDTVPPTVAITGEPPSPSNDTTPTITFTTGGSPTKTECRVDAGTFANCTSPFTSGVLAEGTHTITVRVTDAATNTSSATTAPFVIDTTPPSVTITSQPPALSNDPTATVVFTTANGATTIECRADAGTFAACTSLFATTLADGLHTIQVRVRDDAGNTATATTALFTIDTSAPALTINSEPPALGNQSTVQVTFTADASATSVTCAVDGGTASACTSPFSATLADGTHTITVTAKDAANNATTQTTNPFTIDTQPPTVAITGGPSGPTGETQPQFPFDASADATTIECRVDGNAFDVCTSPFDPGVLGTGSHTVDVRVSDAAGNKATASRSFEIDPMAMCLANTDHGDGDVSGTVENLTTATVEVWFRSTQATGDFELWDFSPPSLYPLSPRVALFHFGTELLVAVDARHNLTQSGAQNQRHFAADTLDLTAWHHYAVVFTGTQTRLFVDGTELTGVQVDGSEATSFADALGGFDTASVPMQLAIGFMPRDNIRFAQGAFLDFRVSSIARFNGSFTPVYPATRDANTVLLFPFDEGSGPTSFDANKSLTWSNPAGWGACFGGIPNP